jgi:hypothetical protein
LSRLFRRHHASHPARSAQQTGAFIDIIEAAACRRRASAVITSVSEFERRDHL